ncbi:MAG TPA: Hpt domain-containing protein [Gammaproteobacteria bacterium]|nr:Hpt domain-containing protein [Gammaproteobacteria bacterium]
MNQLATDSLLWIKGELDGLLLHARQGLEAYAENRDDSEALDRCVQSLHQIQGTLRIVEVHGAALLAEEMEAVATALQDGTLKVSDDVLEALMRAILQLPDYLERVVRGQRDIPLALLSLLNDLRSVRNQPLLSEGALFASTLDDRGIKLPQLPSATASNTADIRVLAKRLRPKFQTALLAWFKKDSAVTPLERMAAIIGQFEQAATRPAVFELWWIVGGVLGALHDGGLEPSVALKQMLGQIDRQIKRLVQESEAEFANEPPRELINNLLYYIGRASSGGERVSSIKQSYNLAELLPDEARLDETRAALSGPNAQLMRTVSAAIKEDIIQVKDSLDIFVRTGRNNIDDLAPLAELLKKVGDTLAVLGLGGLRSELNDQIKALQATVAGEYEVDEAPLMAVAQSLLGIETRLDNDMSDLITEAGSASATEPDPEGAGDSEYKNTFGAVIRESIVNLARVKEVMTEYSRGESTPEATARVPGHIRQVQAGLGLLGMERPAAVLDGVRAFVEQRVLTGAQPSTELMERMADALVSVEFYLETVQSGRGDPQSMLDNAEVCVAQLGVDDADAAPTLSVVDPEGAADGGSDGGEPAAVAEAPAAEPAPAPAEAPSSAPPAAESAPLPQPDEVDPEILEIFLEEAHEELARLGDYFPRWQRNQEDREALTVVRRSFHTLKGSGRMVGARRIGEFAWAIENMLNRVIDGTVEVRDAVVELVGEVLAALPELVEELEAGRSPALDIDGLIQRADAFSRNEQPAPAQPEVAPAPDSEPEPELPAAPVSDAESAPEPADEVDSAAAEPAMDPVLYDIFSKEVASHLEVIEAFLDARETDGVAMVDEALLRAFHTLKGSAYTAGVESICQLAEPAERYLKAVADQHQLLPEASVEVLRRTVSAFRDVLAEIGAPDNTSQDVRALVEELAQLAQRHAEASPEVRAEEPNFDAIANEVEAFVAGEFTNQPEAEEDTGAESGLESSFSESAPGELAPEQPVAAPEDEFTAGSDEAGSDDELDAASASAEDEAPVTQVTPEPPAPEHNDQVVPAAETESADFDPELAAIFFEEARELIESIDVAMQGWSENRQDETVVAELQRHLHTFKGGARMAGLMPLGDLSHELETLLTRVADGRTEVSTRLLQAVQRVVDRLHQMLESSIAGLSVQRAGDLLDELAWLQNGDPGQAPEPAVERVEAAAPEPVDTAPEPEPAVPAKPAPEENRRSGTRIQPELMRVRADLLEAALNHAGEVGIYRSRLEQQTSTMNFNIAELDQTVARLREQLRKFEIEAEAQIVFQHEQEGSEERGEFDPLELDRYSQLQQLSRALMESVGDLASIQALLSNQARESETLLLQQSRVTTELQDNLMRTRMVPFSNHAQRLRRVVRQAAQESGKNAELKLSGAEGEMDRQVLERVLAPLEHMLRNSVVHGIEAPDERERQDKPSAGQITIGLHREGAEVVINIIDDGAGLNIDAIREQAIARGLLDPEARLPESDIMQFIFETGFSTAREVTLSAGRGVGMDVVASEVKQLGGALAIDSVTGAGTRITIRLPFTLAITQALMVAADEDTFAIPLPAIEGIARIPGRDLNRFFAGELKEFTYGGRAYQLQHLSSLLGYPVPQAEEGRVTYPVLLVRSGDNFGALVTESMQGSREVVVKSIGPQLASIRGLSGATILGDGSILLILDPAALLRAPHGRTITPTFVERPAATVDSRKLVMVVDDSITVRRVTQRLLERYGMRVETAKDGVDALTQLQEVTPDVMLLDIEMPRMDGYELATNIRNDERLKKLPIIMITSRTGDKHRNRAMEIGVNEYLGKPYQESDLLEHIQRLIDAAGTAA